MTPSQIAGALRRIAEKLDTHGLSPPWSMGIDADSAVGAAGMLCYIRDLFTVSSKDHFSRGEILVILETISRDPEIFPCGLGNIAWSAEEEDQ